MEDQLSIFTQQHRRILRGYHQVEYIVTDASLLNSLIYQPKGYPPEFEAMVIAFVRRFPYEQNGRQVCAGIPALQSGVVNPL
jgi:hypothetical protein